MMTVSVRCLFLVFFFRFFVFMIESTLTSQSSSDGNGQKSNKNNNPCIRPRILLTGLRRSGKTSIQRVIFTKMPPSQTQFLESTPQLSLNITGAMPFTSALGFTVLTVTSFGQVMVGGTVSSTVTKPFVVVTGTLVGGNPTPTTMGVGEWGRGAH